jgi:hypothetical protein
VVSGYPSGLYDEWLQGRNICIFHAKRKIACGARSSGSTFHIRIACTIHDI